VINILTPLIAL